MAINYSQLVSIRQSLLPVVIEDFTPEVTKLDVDKGFIIRYFTKQVNQAHGEIIEIDQNTFSKLSNNNMYKSIQLMWRISGILDDIPGSPDINMPIRLYTGVITANKLSVQAAELQLPGMINKVINFEQYYVFDIGTL